MSTLLSVTSFYFPTEVFKELGIKCCKEDSPYATVSSHCEEWADAEYDDAKRQARMDFSCEWGLKFFSSRDREHLRKASEENGPPRNLFWFDERRGDTLRLVNSIVLAVVFYLDALYAVQIDC